jgi:hypothetical protein
MSSCKNYENVLFYIASRPFPEVFVKIEYDKQTYLERIANLVKTLPKHNLIISFIGKDALCVIDEINRINSKFLAVYNWKYIFHHFTPHEIESHTINIVTRPFGDRNLKHTMHFDDKKIMPLLEIGLTQNFGLLIPALQHSQFKRRLLSCKKNR